MSFMNHNMRTNTNRLLLSLPLLVASAIIVPGRAEALPAATSPLPGMACLCLAKDTGNWLCSYSPSVTAILAPLGGSSIIPTPVVAPTAASCTMIDFFGASGAACSGYRFVNDANGGSWQLTEGIIFCGNQE